MVVVDVMLVWNVGLVLYFFMNAVEHTPLSWSLYHYQHYKIIYVQITLDNRWENSITIHVTYNIIIIIVTVLGLSLRSYNRQIQAGLPDY